MCRRPAASCPNAGWATAVTDGKWGDVNVLDVLVLEVGAIYVMDRGYLDFGRLYMLHRAQAFFVIQEVLRQFGECGEVATVDRCVGLRPRRDHQKAP